MFYITVIPILFYSIFIIVKLRNLKKHDIILFSFCGLRRDAMQLLRDRGYELGEDNYKSIKRLLKILNHAIHEYNDNKLSFFNFRAFYRSAKQFKDSTKQIEKFQAPSDEEISILVRRLSVTMIYSFLAYTPFLKSEIILRLATSFFRILTNTSIDYISKRTNVMFDAFTLLFQQSQKYDIPLKFVGHSK
jgi:hypothetical protein